MSSQFCASLGLHLKRTYLLYAMTYAFPNIDVVSTKCVIELRLSTTSSLEFTKNLAPKRCYIYEVFTMYLESFPCLLAKIQVELTTRYYACRLSQFRQIWISLILPLRDNELRYWSKSCFKFVNIYRSPCSVSFNQQWAAVVQLAGYSWLGKFG